MAWRLAGSYLAVCPCKQVCPCSYDVAPNVQDGVCRGTVVFQVREGNLDAVSLTGVNFAMLVEGRNRLSEGNWKVGLVIDRAASDQQAKALEQIVSGQAGGLFADLKAIFSEVAPTQREAVTYSDGDRPTASVAGRNLSVEPFTGEDGKPTTVRNAMFGFAPEYLIGWGKGRQSVLGVDSDSNYGEAAQYEYKS